MLVLPASEPPDVAAVCATGARERDRG
jgi:hypothetical protein